MEIQQFISDTAKGIIPVATLTTLAADRRAFGDDIMAAFTTQVQQRSQQAQTVLDAATAAGRDTLLASEQRSYDGAIRERDSILGLQRAVEQRTEARAHVPATQTSVTDQATETADLSPVLTKEQRCAEYVSKRGGARYGGERGAESMRFGAIVRALALGDRGGLSELERRALEEGSGASGGYTVPEVLGAGFIDRVRNNMVVMKAGAVTVPMTSDVLHLARLAQPGMFTNTSPSVSAASWKAENSDITEAAMTLERVTFTARTLPMLINLSVELSEDSANIDAIIEREMSRAMAIELDRAALRGSGVAPEPKGVRYQTDVTVTAVNASKTNYDWMIDAIGVCWGENFDPNARIYGATLATAIAKYKSSVDAQPLIVPPSVAAVSELRSNQAASGEAYFGDWSQLMIGLRTSFRLEVSRVAGDAFSKLQIAVRAYLRADVQLAHPEAFVVCTGVS
jgi:HK97 family phage major capsid protein